MADNEVRVFEAAQAALKQIINDNAIEVDPAYMTYVKVNGKTEGTILSYRTRVGYNGAAPLDEVGRVMRRAYRDVLRSDASVGKQFRDMRTFILTGGCMPTNTFFFEDVRRTRTTNIERTDQRDERVRKIELRAPSEAAAKELAEKMMEELEKYKTESRASKV